MGAPDGEENLDDDLDAGWDDDEDDADVDELDSGWEGVEPPPGESSQPTATRRRKREERAALRELTPEEREARAARAAERKERNRSKAAEKADRRKAKVSQAAAKQKKSLPRERTVKASASVRPRPAPVEDPGDDSAEDSGEEIRAEGRASVAPAQRRTPSVTPSWLGGRNIAVAVLVLLVGGAIAFVLTRR